MAVFTQDSIIGETGDHAVFLANTKTWNEGGAALATPDLFVVGTNDVTIDGTTAVVRALGGSNVPGLGTNTPIVSGGTIIVRNGGTITYGDNAILTNFNAQVDLDFDDFLVNGSLPGYTFHGAFDCVIPPTFNLRNGKFYLDVNQVDFTEQYYLFFAGDINPASVISNVSFWNGQTGIRSKGGVPGLTTVANYSGLVLGPAGLWTNASSNSNHRDERNIIRFANQGVATATRNNNLCWFGNLDFRALSTIQAVNNPTGTSFANPPTSGNERRSWTIVTDTNANVWLINPYIGRPRESTFTTLSNGRLAFASYFGLGNAKVLTGTNPVKTGSGSRNYTFTQADVTEGIYRVPATIPTGISAANIPDALTARLLKDTGAGINGFLFEQQDFVGIIQAGTTRTISHRTRFEEIVAKSYRIYDWLQQPTNTEFGTLVTLTPPPEQSATGVATTDAQIATAIAGGYDTFDSGFTSETLRSYTDDAVIIASGLTEITANTQRALPVGSIVSRNGNEITAHAKVVAWNESEAVNTTNTKVNLAHSVTGTVLDLGSQNLVIGTQSTIQPNSNTTTGTTFGIRASDITIGVDSGNNTLIDTISTDGSIILQDFGVSTATNKASLQAGSTTAGNVTVIHTTDATIRNINMSGGGTFLATGETFDGCDLDFGLIQGDNTTHSNCTIEVGSGYTDIEGDTNTNVTYVGTFNGVIGGSNNVSRTLEQVFGTGFDTSGATITLLADTGVTGLSVAATNAELTAANVTLGAGIAQVLPPLSRSFSFAKNGKYTLGRVRGGTFTAISTFEVPVQTISTRVITTGTDGWLAGDTIRIRFLPTNGTSGNTSLYVPTTIDTPLTDGATVIDHTPVVTEILASVDISDTLVSGAVITNTAISGTNIPFIVTITDDLELPQTKGLYFELFQHTGTLLHMNTNNFDAADMFSIGALGITHNEVNSSIAKPTIAVQRAITGVSSVGANALIAAGDSAATNTYVIATTGGTRDFIVNRVPAGITEGQVEAALGRRIIQAELGTIQNQEAIAAALPRVALSIPSPVILPDEST